jgi:hypothetical protein
VNVEQQKMIFGFLALVVLATLAAIIALGKVHQDTSYGLDYILGGLTMMTGGFANWAFGAAKEVKEIKSSSE